MRLTIFIGLLSLPLFGSFDSGQAFLQKYCRACHTGQTAAGGFRLDRVAAPTSLTEEPGQWGAIVRRVRNAEMPPKGAPAPSLDESEAFVSWAGKALREAACAGGLQPGPARLRRLNRDEYSATIRDLLDIHLDMGQPLPADGGGGEGFDNAAETLFLSPLHSEKYMDAARFALDFAAKEFKSRNRILIALPGRGVTESQAARRVLEAFLPRAFRSPVEPAAVDSYLALYRQARASGQTFEESIFFALRAVLVSPRFLFLLPSRNPAAAVRPLDDYALASRLSYFLWGSMPDEFLFDVTASGKLQEPAVLKALVGRMLRNDRSLGFAQRFVDQWLSTRELNGTKRPDAKLFPEFDRDEELRSDIRMQPVLFFREMLVRNLPVLSLIDSTHTVGTRNLAKLYEAGLPVNRAAANQPQWVELPAGSNRGGLLGMPAILAVSSYPYRTSPVLRGAWILESLLGTPPPPPPPNVPALEEPSAGAPSKSMRERLAHHRSNAVCAGCHSRIDGLGFALENYDVLGRWRAEEGGKPIDNSGELGGRTFHGSQGLRQILLERKDLFVHHLTTKMLGYALGRGLTLNESCTVDSIVEQVKNDGYKAQTLVEAIVLSVPFRYQPPAAAK
jgi:mono/diheme cytochrome c family protein